MRLRFTRYRLALYIAALLFLASLLGGTAFWLLFAFPWYLGFKWYLGGTIGSAYDGIYLLAILVAAVSRSLFAAYDDIRTDSPILLPLESEPLLSKLVEATEKEANCRIAKPVWLVLSPSVWRPHGCDVPIVRDTLGGTVIPVCCLDIWSVTDLKCHLALNALRPRLPRWLFRSARSVRMRLQADVHAERVNGMGNPAPVSQWIAARMAGASIAWNFLADLEAAEKAASAYGAETIADWRQRDQLAQGLIPDCLITVIEPAFTAGSILPITSICKIMHDGIEPTWRTAVFDEVAAAERRGDLRGASPIAAQLTHLRYTDNSFARHDPRPASTLFTNLPAIAEAVLRNEMPSIPGELRYAGTEEIAELVILPRMRRDLQRNADLLAGCTLHSLPGLAQRVKELATSYKPDPPQMRTTDLLEFETTQLLDAFLTIQLLAEGWQLSYAFGNGLLLHRKDQELRPSAVIAQLISGEMTADQFLAILELAR